jgi:two-component system, chemotaxis family, chemotaxis protein CheY
MLIQHRSGSVPSLCPKERCFRVLMIDDNKIFRQQFREALCERFPALHVEEAGDLMEGLEKFHNLTPKLVFLDISLPDGSGLYLADRIRRESPGTIVVLCTMYDVPEYRGVALRLGIDHFFRKDRLDWNQIGALIAEDGVATKAHSH